MKRSTRRRRHSVQAPVKRISAVAATLPTKDQIEAAKADLDAVIAFFQRRRQFLDTLPPAGDGGHGTQGNQVFDTLLDHTKRNPALALAFGMKPSAAPGVSPALDLDGDHRRARALCDLINSWI